MSPLLASTALGLVAAWPVGAMGLGLGRLVERMTGDPRPRAAAWSLAHGLPAAALAVTVALTMTPTPVPGAAARGSEVAQRLTAALALPTGGAPAAPALLPSPALTEGAAWSLLALSSAGLITRVAVGLRGRRRLAAIRANASRTTDPALTQAVAVHAARLGVSPPPVLVSDRIGEPLLIGTRRPAILLPKALADARETAGLALVCAHELVHLRRGDNWRLPVEDALTGLFWLAPPVAALRRRTAAAREAVCDLAALDGAPPRARHDYARLLVDALRANAHPAAQSAFTGRQRSLVEMRLSAILQPRQAASPARLALALALGGALTAATGAGSLALAREAKAAKPAQAAPTAKLGDIEFMADRMETHADGKRRVLSGGVTLRGDLNRDAVNMTVNGAPAPADFDVTHLPDGAIDRLEVITPKATRDGKYVFNVTLAAAKP
ncbi:M56 family metallopeptidase [Caulobacter segnis]|uniref:Peptidase M56 n=1 Tax=Caulobacter segnis TaxID=88688 RepID=A0A2W5VHN8_9CAUL|nr:M56 family metallopeptidase [Caulobacter segnis]PZR37463.1 MAG: peptidase M56 [Caulobacter segnis]